MLQSSKLCSSHLLQNQLYLGLIIVEKVVNMFLVILYFLS